MTSDTSKTKGLPSAPQVTVAKQADLGIRKPDLKSAAAELTRRMDDIKKSIAGIEKAKTVSQGLLRKEVSI
jgi:hypothetical protein